MRYRESLSAIVLIAVIVLGLPQERVRMQAVSAGPPKFALLVGINRYKNHPDVKNLDGAHNDVGLIKSFLVEYGFKEELASPASETAPCGDQKPTSGVRTLCSQQATKKLPATLPEQPVLKQPVSAIKSELVPTQKLVLTSRQ